MLTSISGSTSFDLTAVGRKKFRDRLREALGEIEGAGEVQESHTFWTSFYTHTLPEEVEPTVVVADLAAVARRFKQSKAQDWTASVRRSGVYFLAFVRTEQDKRHAAWVDDLVKASDLRFNVCNNADDWPTVARCLTSAVSVLRPEALLDVRFERETDRLWLHFSDGLAGVVGWEELGLADIRPSLVAESAIVGERGDSVVVSKDDGSRFELDGLALRAMLDAELRETLSERNRESGKSVGERVKDRRNLARLKQAELGERAGLDQAVISRIERGKVRPRIDTLRQIAEALDLTLGELLSAP